MFSNYQSSILKALRTSVVRVISDLIIKVSHAVNSACVLQRFSVVSISNALVLSVITRFKFKNYPISAVNIFSSDCCQYSSSVIAECYEYYIAVCALYTQCSLLSMLQCCVLAVFQYSQCLVMHSML